MMILKSLLIGKLVAMQQFNLTLKLKVITVEITITKTSNRCKILSCFSIFGKHSFTCFVLLIATIECKMLFYCLLFSRSVCSHCALSDDISILMSVY